MPEPRGFLLIRRSPDGKITADARLHITFPHAALASAKNLVTGGYAGTANARLFAEALTRRPPGTIWGHPSGLDYRILCADFTADRVPITPGLRVLDYDRRWGTVYPDQFMDDGMMTPGGEYFDGWYYVQSDGDDRPYKKFNGERMTTREPARG